MLNYKCKSHRGRSSTNRTDALCIIEYGSGIVRAFAKTIPDKKQTTILPIICSQVLSGSMIYTDEHGAYRNLNSHGFTHGTVCHKYNFVDRITGIHTQAIESFNNCLKVEIKNRKGVKTNDRDEFLKEFCYLFNNRNRLIDAIFDILKVN
ncbi:hypothetical protein DMUE_6406 [Dictyocoela muelleri]|nr:hypothetical protein DMUE_6406 [Dictyocoela muelleri]